MPQTAHGQSPAAPIERQHGDYLLSDDPTRLDACAVHAYLSRSYWAEGIPLEVVRRSLNHSLCIGAYAPNGRQVGLVRLITDRATFCYVCDVYVLEEHRGQGLAKAMLALADTHPTLQGLRRWNLVTRDAHNLYRQFGYEVPTKPERYMERLDREVYRRRPASPG
jgi:GNAT superfamily N-acetyltransferase